MHKLSTNPANYGLYSHFLFLFFFSLERTFPATEPPGKETTVCMKIHGEEMCVQQLISQWHTNHEIGDILQWAFLNIRCRMWKKILEHNPDGGCQDGYVIRGCIRTKSLLPGGVEVRVFLRVRESNLPLEACHFVLQGEIRERCGWFKAGLITMTSASLFLYMRTP